MALRLRMAGTVRFNFRAIKALSIFESNSANSCASSAGVHGRPLGRGPSFILLSPSARALQATHKELRRMYLDEGYRGLGIAQHMLDCAQAEARALGFTKMIVSTAQIQQAAERFYRKNGFIQIRTEVAETMTTKQAGGGLTRFHFEKAL